MKYKWKKGDKISIKSRFDEMQELMKPFIKKYYEPVLVHATPNSLFFKQILKDKKLKVPLISKMTKHSYIERMLGIYPCTFLSLGFAYASSYDFKYSFIFSLNYLKKSEFYMNSLSYQSYKAVIQYWDKNNPEYLHKLASKNAICKAVVDKFYNETYNGKNKVLFDFWKVEKETFDLIQKYPKKKELIRIIKEVVNEKFLKYPDSLNWVKINYKEDNVPEIPVKQDINLKDNPDFLGFYIRGNIPKDILKMLQREYPDKILFDGKKIIKINQLN